MISYKVELTTKMKVPIYSASISLPNGLDIRSFLDKDRLIVVYYKKNS